jgi:hypothetical protein
LDAAAELIFDYQYQICGPTNCSVWHFGPKTARLGPGYELKIPGLVKGNNRVVVRASDRAGNTDQSPVVVDLHYQEPPQDGDRSPKTVQSMAHYRSLQQDFEIEADALELEGEPSARDLHEKIGWVGRILALIRGNSASASRSDLRRRMRREL